MNHRRFPSSLAVLATVLTLAGAPTPLHAYGGPGSIISGIGAFIAVLAALFAAIVGFLWYPLKRLIRAIRGTDAASDDVKMDKTDAGGEGLA